MRTKYNKKPPVKTDAYADFNSLRDLHKTADRYLQADRFFKKLRKYAFDIGDERYKQLHDQALRGDVVGAEIILRNQIHRKYAG